VRVLSSKEPLYATLPNGYEPLNPTQLSPIYAAVTTTPGDNLVRYLERKRGHALNILSLSGGGQNGAFGAGFLVGWRESGRRPQFDAVGGVSTGALLSTHAFLGTPADDATLEEMYTRITKADIYNDIGLISVLFGADSLRDTAPLRAMLEKYITAETLKRVADAYDENRMLFVGTTNIDYGQTWVWNMTAIAKAGDLELYRKVLLASASFPIVFPPVEIGGHLPFVRRWGCAFESGGPGNVRESQAQSPPVWCGESVPHRQRQSHTTAAGPSSGPWSNSGDNHQCNDGAVDADRFDEVVLRYKGARLWVQDRRYSRRRQRRQ
jgi:hypothetical protein